MGVYIGSAIVIIFISVVTFLVAKEIRKGNLGGEEKIPSEFRSILIIGLIIFLIFLALLIYSNFFMTPHYNY